MPRTIRQSKRLLFLLGFVGWLVLWPAFYVIANAANPRLNLAGAILLIWVAVLINLVAIFLLLLTKLRCAALGYAAAMAINGIGLLLVLETSYIGNYALYSAISFPFFLPSSFAP